MSLPSIRITLPLIGVCWCLGAVVAGKAPLLLYPLMWAAVSGLLYAAFLFTKPGPSTDSGPAAAEN